MMLMKFKTPWLALLVAVVLLGAFGCNRNSGSSSVLTAANYAKVTPGMTRAQVELILGAPTTTETKDMVIFKKTTERWESGTQFVMVTFKNDEVQEKTSNLNQ
jgi:outer membrane protein assembly factor BamE (lipoprotein component of BamABCDE complex)